MVRWTEEDFQAARGAFIRSQWGTVRQRDDAIRAALQAVEHRLQPPAAAVSDVVLEAMERDGWTPTLVRALIADYRRVTRGQESPPVPHAQASPQVARDPEVGAQRGDDAQGQVRANGQHARKKAGGGS